MGEVEESRDPPTQGIIGAAMAVPRELGPGFLEPVYHAALALEFDARLITYHHEVELPVHYKGQRLDVSYRPDVVCYDSVIVEVKALSRLSGVEEAQVINYLKATGLAVGLLLNFGTPSLCFKRFVLTRT